MKIRLLSLILCLFSIHSFASNFYQIPVIIIDTTEAIANNAVQDSSETDVVTYWDEKNAVGLDFNEVAFVNWSSGGNNSISALLHGDFERNYKKKLTNWKNSAVIRYGINAQEGREVRKTEDELVLSSSFGYRRDSTSNFYYSAKMDFNTQFTNGYRYPETDNPISKFMAPGYLFLGVGAEFSHPEEDLTVYFSPITQKSTFVLDQRLANEGMFGVTPAVRDEEGNLIEEGESVRTEFGMLLTSKFAKEVFENINLKNRLSLYSDYLNKFGNIDVDWQMNVNLKVNDFVKASVGSHIRYDDDVKYKEDFDGDGELETTGPRLQFKQTLGVGVVYEF